MEYYKEDGKDFTYRLIHKEIVFQKPLPVGYSKLEEESSDLGLDLSSPWDKNIISVRGNWLVKKHPELEKSFSECRDLNKLAREYVSDDYIISPRTARRIIYYALERLVDKSELDEIETDLLIKRNKRKKVFG